MLQTTSRPSRPTMTDPALERRLDRLGLTGHEDEWTDRYLLCHHLVDPKTARPRQQFEFLYGTGLGPGQDAEAAT